MRKFLISPLLVFAILIGYSSYLAYKGENEAAMAGAGVAVDVVSGKQNTEENKEEKENLVKALREENDDLRIKLELHKQFIQMQAIIKYKE